MQLDYQENLKLFKEREKERDYIRNISKDQNKSKQYLSDQKRLFFTNIAKPDYFNKAKKGITEDYFKEFLEEYFTNEIYTDVTINQKGMYGFPFTPDFVLCNSSEGFCIDIEINEPYTSDNRKPIHFVINEEKTIDYIRDEFFLNNNWPIIKFSEEQIIKNPIGCCYYIAETILLLFSNSKYLLKFKNVPPLLHIVAWDYDEALRKSKEKFREKLLLEIGINLHPSVQEKKAIYDIDELPF